MVDTGNLDFSDNVFSILERLVCYDPAARLNSEEVLEDKYFVEEPIPVLTLKLRVPSPQREENSFSDDWAKWKDMEADSDLENFDSFTEVMVSALSFHNSSCLTHFVQLRLDMH